MLDMPLDQSNTPWSMWKAHWRENVWVATAAASMEAGAFFLFLCLMAHDSHLLSIAGLGTISAFWLLNVAVSALNAYLKSHPQFAPADFARHPRN